MVGDSNRGFHGAVSEPFNGVVMSGSAVRTLCHLASVIELEFYYVTGFGGGCYG